MRKLALVSLLWPAPTLAQVVPLDADHDILEPVARSNVAVYPIVAKRARDGAAPLTLDEAAAAGLVEVREKEQAQVSRITVKNKADRPLLLLAGEIVKGGRQDRAMGKDVLVPPGAVVDVTSFCVEQGRWGGGGRFSSAGALAHPKLRARAVKGDQGQVWQEVADKNRKRGAGATTTSYQGTLGSLPAEVDARAAALEAELAKLPPDRLVGMGVAVDGKVVAVEVFATPATFGKVRRKLLRSYVTQAIDEAGAGQAAPPPAPAAARVKALADDGDAAKPGVVPAKLRQGRHELKRSYLAE